MPSNPHLESDTFCFGPMDRVPMGWGETEVRELSDRLANDLTTLKPLQWGAVLILWAFNAIWFCDNAHTLRKCSGVPVKWMRVRCACLLHKLELALELEQRPAFAKCACRSPQMLRITYHGPPELLEANTESESEEMAEPAAGPEASRASLPTGDVSLSDEESEGGIERDAQASVAEEELVTEATNAGVEERSPTPPGLDAGSLGSDLLLAGRKRVAPASPVPPVATGEDAREPPLKKAKGFTRTGWPLALNQQLREGQTQPAMRANMEAMQDEGLLLVGRFNQVRSLQGSERLLLRLPPTSKSSSQFPRIGKVAHKYWRIEGSQMNLHPPVGGGTCGSGKLKGLRVPLGRRTFLDGQLDFLGEQIPSPVVMDGEQAALRILIGRHGGSPSWVEHLGGHNICTTLNILNLGSHSIEVKEEVDELIAQGFLYTMNSDPAIMDKKEQCEADTSAYPSNTQPPQGRNDNPRLWEYFGGMGVAFLNVCPRMQKYDNSLGT
ncbi:hypothetical protein IW261DRAFT_1424264 [Armillaria novae-zelandiae]|uniref:Uncharacterized protein n=1 Tax=Armillaria novae-zelandiae TaxID=153914 RepID=A0AA39NW06_9AGAR|nr:hypothetical protein IW261DRAFT_1424264 [Armillaria novae-zelandiae]